jgi:hypothetical protein
MKSILYTKAKDVSIFLEDGQYYIRYVGVINDGSDEYELVVPKMDINVTVITQSIDECSYNGFDTVPRRITLRRNIYTDHDVSAFTIRRVKKKMTKEQIEKELGYKIEIEDED